MLLKNKKSTLYFLLPIYFLSYSPLSATEYKIKGIVDVRVSKTNSLEKSYISAGQGKYGLDNGEQLFLAQAGAELSIDWENGLSAHSVINGYLNDNIGNTNNAGITEAYFKYRTLPNNDGYRFQVRTGIFYPEISLENNAYAWASKDTLNSSTLNTWIGEEVRVLGGEFKATRLGRLNNNKFDLSVSASLFMNNDPSGALLAWHGWTMSSRQTLWTEKLELPWFPAREPGNDLAGQASDSDPFLEIDNKFGYHLHSDWRLHNKGKISAGYYDNRAVPYKVKNGQYGWHTRFFHAGIQWHLAKYLSLTSQYLIGKTLMQSPNQRDIVNNDYENMFASFTFRWKAFIDNNKHKSTLRIEHFSVTDNDQTEGDNNTENGNALTANHTYRLTKHWFLSGEFNIIDSYRPARAYEKQPIDLIETQYQLAARYFF